MSSTDEDLVLGPFIGGLNNRNYPDLIEDNELAECTNIDFELDGSMKVRQGIDAIATQTSLTFVVIGVGKLTDLDGLNQYIFISNNGTVRYSKDLGVTWTTLTGPTGCHSAIFYNDFVYLIPNGSNTGGRWAGTGFSFVADATLPGFGIDATVFKSRIWVAARDGTKITFSDPITAATPTWPAANVIEINAQDGDFINKLLRYNDDLLIFKNDSTWLFSFDLLPEDGLVRNVSEKIGISSRLCAEIYGNSIFILHEEIVYEFSNYSFTRLNDTLALVGTNNIANGGQASTEKVALSVIDDKVIVKFYDSTFVYNIPLGNWSKWEGTNIARASKWWELDKDPTITWPTSIESTYEGKYYLANHSISDSTQNTIMYKTQKGIASSEIVTASFKTKTYDFGEPLSFKRMRWWAANVISTAPVVANWTFQAFPDKVAATAHVISVGGSNSDYENNIRFPDAVRFRKIHFKVTFTADLTTSDTGAVSTLHAILRRRQTVTKQVNI